MSESSAFDFTKFVPGFDFLKKLSESQATFPQAQQWIAPTVDPKEIEKRIQELKTVHFWLEQNTRAVLATVQALEVQLMTINTLKGMNMSMSEMAKGLEIKPQNASQRGDAAEQSSASKKKDYFAQNASVDPFKPSSGPANHESATDTDRDTDADLSADALKPDASANSAQDSVSKGQASQAVDPMAWWGALSQQFSQIANQTFSEIQKNSAAVAAAQSKAAAPQSKEKKADRKTEKATTKTKVKPQTKPKTQPKSQPKSAAIAKAKAKLQANSKANSKVKASEKAPLKTAVKSPTKVATSKAAVKKTVTVKSAQAKKSTDTSDPVVALKSWFSSPPALTRKGAQAKKGT